MDKWADYLISEVSYDANHLISVAVRHQDTDKGITKGTSVDRLTISSDIKNGLSYITIYSGKNSWKKGHRIHTFSIGGNPFLRIDRNKVELDHLGDLPVVTSIDLNELDLAPEPVTEEPEEEEATPEQLARLEQLEKQIQELESRPEPTPPSPRGSLPKESTEELLQELDLSLEPVIEEPLPEPEEEATSEQLEQLDELQKQIDELESKLSEKPVPEMNSEPEVEPVIDEYSEFNDLEDQIDELENELTSKLHPSEEATEEQISRVNELEKEIEKLEAVDIEHEIIQTLQKQNKKLDDIEKKLGQPSPQTSSESSSIEAYCVKCKTKRKVKNPEETIMKNGRPAVKGECSTCNCKVFRIGKMKK